MVSSRGHLPHYLLQKYMLSQDQIKQLIKKALPEEIDDVTKEYVESAILDNEKLTTTEFHELISDTVLPFVVWPV